MNILAIDGSTQRTGWATIVNDKQLEYGTIGASNSRVEARIIKMRDEILNIVKTHNIEKVVMEEVRPDGLNLHTGIVLRWLQASIVLAVFEYNKDITVDFVGASSWRKQLGLQGYKIKREEQKKKDIEYAENRYNLDLAGDDDAADAICILDYARKSAPIILDGFELG
ncbi:MAG: hypothetical protein J6T34_01265 [Bacilli bacterium]|nr:hypothetical protein [Bacilli bacterium]